MSIRLTAEVRIIEIDGQDSENQASLTLEDDGSDTVRLIFFGALETQDKKLSLTIDKDDLLEAVCRVSGSDIRLKEDH